MVRSNSLTHDTDSTFAQLQEISEQNEAVVTDSDATDGYSPPGNLSLPGNESMVSKLLSTRGHLSFDQLSGRLRYFGPTTNCHVHSDLHRQNELSHRQALEQTRRTQRVINTLTMETHDYLMDLFWTKYNSVLHVIHQEAFEDGRENGGNFYSGFLHVCILAMGYRFAEKTRPDMLRIAMPNQESTLHQAAKFMLDYEIEQPGGIPSIVALLLLGDLECGVGRDNVGWLYAGMANRLCFDIGLHLDRSNSGLSQREIEIGRMTLLACVVYDKYWALFLGRPTSLKSSDLETYHLSQQFARLGKSLPAVPERRLEQQIYESLLELMEIAGKITEIMDQASRLDDNVNLNHHVFVRMANLNRELEIWYSRLAKPLQWTPENVQSAPFSFFLLHQQYHVTMILLHRPFARYGDIQPANPDNMEDYTAQPNMHLSSMSRTICTQHAVRVARIFWQHRQRYDTRQIFVTGLQHAGTAATALVAALASLKDPSSRDANMHYLETLAAALEDMAQTYQPAERMSSVLQEVIIELRATVPQTKQHKVVPTRRESTNDDDTEEFVPSKRHQSFRTSPPRSMPSTFIPQSRPQQQQHQPQPQPRANLTPTTNEIEAPSPSMQNRDPTLANPPSLDGFVVVTPRTEAANLEGAWPALTNAHASVLDYPMFTSNRSAFSDMAQTSAWMGAETPAVSPPPSANSYIFQPSAFPGSRLTDDAGSNQNTNGNGVVGNNLDFLSLLDRGDFSGLVGGREDDFALLPTPTVTPTIPFNASSDAAKRGPPAMNSSSTRTSADRRYPTPSRQQDGSAASTMAGLDALYAQMKGNNRMR